MRWAFNWQNSFAFTISFPPALSLVCPSAATVDMNTFLVSVVRKKQYHKTVE